MIGYLSGVYDVLRAKDLQKLDMAIQKNKEQKNEYFALALYTEELCEKLGINEPLKNIDDRLKIAEQLNGVDFVFSISSLDKNLIQKNAEEALEKYIERKKEEKNEKKEFNLVYAPGTYDLFHAGHLENLLEASSRSNILIVGVKSDELVEEHKRKKPYISANERMEILRHFKFVHNVYQYYTRDPHIAATWIESKYHQKVDAIFLGSDLRPDFKDIKDIKLIFTYRDEKNMETRSTTGYTKKLNLRTTGKKEIYTGKIENIDNSKKQEETNSDTTFPEEQDDR